MESLEKINETYYLQILDLIERIKFLEKERMEVYEKTHDLCGNLIQDNYKVEIKRLQNELKELKRKYSALKK